MSKRKTFSKAFKLEALNLLENSEMTATEVARHLGIRRNQLYKWKEQFDSEGESAFERSLGRPKKSQETELVRLRKELAEVKMERDILKKAAAYFAKELP